MGFLDNWFSVPDPKKKIVELKKNIMETAGLYHSLWVKNVNEIMLENALTNDRLLEEAHKIIKSMIKKPFDLDFYGDGFDSLAEELAQLTHEKQDELGENFQIKLIFEKITEQKIRVGKI